MVLNWFFKDEFEKFYIKVERLQKYLRIADKELLIDHFVELRVHFRQIKKLLPKLIKLYRKELKIIEKIPESEYRTKLKKFAKNLEKELDALKSWVNNALVLLEEILKIRVLDRVVVQKQKLRKIINHLTNLLISSQRDAFELVQLEKSWKKSVKKGVGKPASKIQVVGRLRNGWNLGDIQNVIIDLGGKVEPNKGSHPYKIVFPKQRKIPLAESTHSLVLVTQISRITNVDKKTLIASFAQGELLAA